MTGNQRILLVEDEPYVRDSMAEVLRAEGFHVVFAGDVAEAERALRDEDVGACLLDLRLPGESGMELLARGSVAESGVPVVMITGHGTVEHAVEAMRRGAWDFVQKPIDPEGLLLVVRRALEHGRLQGEVRRLRTAMHRTLGARTLAGSSPAMEAVRRLIAQVAPTESNVLVTGESGTGKELVCNELHARSARAAGPLLFVNCAAIPETLAESELFGHRKGAFTGAGEDRPGRFEEARGGTLVLDEVEALSPEAQAKCLRVLESGEYRRLGDSRTRRIDCRIVAVSNEDLKAKVEAGAFRADLFWRLDVFPIHLPPLREHLSDLEEIVRSVLARVRARTGVAAPAGGEELDEDALRLCRAYRWPGNVRELRNVLERAVILAGPKGALTADVLEPLLSAAARAAPGGGSAADAGLNLRARREQLERELVVQALAASRGQRKEAAALLGIDPKNIAYYMKKLGLAEGDA